VPARCQRNERLRPEFFSASGNFCFTGRCVTRSRTTAPESISPVVALARRLPSLEIGIVPVPRESAHAVTRREVWTTMRWFTRCKGVALALLLGAPEAQALAPRSLPVGDAVKTVNRPTSSRRPSASVRISPSTPGRPNPSGALAALRSRPPVPGPINSDFGTRRSFWRRQFHTGIDIAASRGTPVQAPMGGTVTFAGWRGGYGKTIIIDHGEEFRTLYGHLSRVGVRRGQRVESGAAIGATGASGNASGPHLHYEILAKGRPINPRGPVSKITGPHGTARGPGGTILP
jgi:murein DD-endopeptidase MepM/ murein hydrolase activator NlpD